MISTQALRRINIQHERNAFMSKKFFQTLFLLGLFVLLGMTKSRPSIGMEDELEQKNRIKIGMIRKCPQCKHADEEPFDQICARLEQATYGTPQTCAGCVTNYAMYKSLLLRAARLNDHQQRREDELTSYVKSLNAQKKSKCCQIS